jgi:hypothetical protein
LVILPKMIDQRMDDISFVNSKILFF